MAATKQKRTFKEKYDIPEEEIRSLVERAQNKEGQAYLTLLEVFSNFLVKYTSLLQTGKFNLTEYDMRRFLALFVKDPKLRGAVLRNKVSGHYIKQLNEVIHSITYMINRYCDDSDIEQTVNMAFMHCVSVYKPKGEIPFSGFLYSYYLFILKKMVESLLIDQLGLHTFPLIDSDSTSDLGDENSARQPGMLPPAAEEVYDSPWSEEIDEFWVSGSTASFPFDRLTIQERQLLKWRYADREKCAVIANRITEHPNTVRDHFNKIRQKLKQVIAEEGI